LTSSLLFVVIVHAIRDINIKSKVPQTHLEATVEPTSFVSYARSEREPAVGDVAGD
jgi:hypothetical protein